ncbi:MAG: hypothetical protein A2451_02570 [Bdellovibrionales bacterium RIFOXYC2_FULL_39_8]|nr:MAG: hypothetical protein A2404_07965 [Bdellovibrionales bacterium RIFOXYC1_FULL_39_130]OFZ73928.1 MAG: hypothetical protein A2451_02570 [Bdellovibrionales bacterium RIFOXYC2_FULL_39_8]
MEDKWLHYENSKQTNDYINGLEKIHESLIAQMSPCERPWFVNHWLKILNLSECYMLKHNDECVAIATYPKIKDTHYYRWQNCTLSVKSGIEIGSLPRPVNKSEYFITPAQNSELAIGFSISGMKISISQVCTALRISENSKEQNPPLNVENRIVKNKDDAEASSSIFMTRLLEFGKDDFFNTYYLAPITHDISLIPTNKKRGWGVYSIDKTTTKPIASAYYSPWELPLGGPAAALVDDIVVLPEYRKKGIASSLQYFALNMLRQNGVSWICGNIEPNNFASLKQSENLGRRPWSITIEVKN